MQKSSWVCRPRHSLGSLNRSQAIFCPALRMPLQAKLPRRRATSAFDADHVHRTSSVRRRIGRRGELGQLAPIVQKAAHARRISKSGRRRGDGSGGGRRRCSRHGCGARGLLLRPAAAKARGEIMVLGPVAIGHVEATRSVRLAVEVVAAHQDRLVAAGPLQEVSVQICDAFRGHAGAE